MTISDFRERRAAERRIVRETVRTFVMAAQAGDIKALSDIVCQFDLVFGLGPACLRAAARLPDVPWWTKKYFRELHYRDGDHLRQELGDRILVDAYRVLLPSYRGPAVLLYRGEGADNRRRRCYGLSWSANRSVAERFAEGTSRMYEDGSVLLETLAPPEAILMKMPKRYGEDEYLVDRRSLRAVRVLQRSRRI
ncbi:hypothetical protein E0H72_26430 [Rhizobium leguminosarum bv. viciae]|uniref:hypothetical protein n=1 Tax=Rhizobium leguminosarum TaxID=384 RepID=UPI00103C0204|nr:hypothetical protein [Rhizobium leguminosarum]TCA38498.1 hypothetical protein E0H72_26430 [Rhizobium leguminosarum bv. viciae]